MKKLSANNCFEFFVVFFLLAFGTYHSVLYFGRQPVPNPDFFTFVRTGKSILAFTPPENFKRAPVVGVLIVGLGRLIGGRYPELTAGWLLNAFLHPLNLVLLWLVGRKIVGSAAFWIALVAGLNPWVIRLLSEPIAETTFLFFVLLTFYCIFRGSSWSYFFAAITSLVRYDGAALILVAFVMDLIGRKSGRERFRAFCLAAIASVPLALWSLGTLLNWPAETQTHYLKEMGKGSGGKFPLIGYLELIWEAEFVPLFLWLPRIGGKTTEFWSVLAKTFVSVAFLIGTVAGLRKKHWNILALLIFFVCYSVIHIKHSFLVHRYCTTIFWIPLFISWSGLQACWSWLDRGDRVPKLLKTALPGGVILGVAYLIIKLLGVLPGLEPLSPMSASLPYVAIAVGVILVAVRFFHYRSRYLLQDCAVLSLVSMLVLSNQCRLLAVVGRGERDIEFKRLAEWYLENSRPDEKLVGSHFGVLKLYAPECWRNFIPLRVIAAESPSDFIERCRRRGITYVAWDSRTARYIDPWYRRLSGIELVGDLSEPIDIGPYEFVARITNDSNPRCFINLFKLRPRRVRKPHQKGGSLAEEVDGQISP